MHNIKSLPYSLVCPVHYLGFSSAFFCWSTVIFSFRSFIVSCWSLIWLLSDIYTLPQHPDWIHPGKFRGENEAYKISPWWKRFGFSTSPVCIGNSSLLESNFELLMFPSEIHPGKFRGENEAYKISPWWKRFGFSTSPVCIGNSSLLESNFEILMFPSEFLKFWYFPGDIAQAVLGPCLTSVTNLYRL